MDKTRLRSSQVYYEMYRIYRRHHRKLVKLGIPLSVVREIIDVLHTECNKEIDTSPDELCPMSLITASDDAVVWLIKGLSTKPVNLNVIVRSDGTPYIDKLSILVSSIVKRHKSER